MTVITHKQLHASIPSMGSFLDLRAGVSQTDATLIYSIHLCFFYGQACPDRFFWAKIHAEIDCLSAKLLF